MRESELRSWSRIRAGSPIGRRDTAQIAGVARRRGRRKEGRKAAETILAGEAGASVAAPAGRRAAVARSGERRAIAGLATAMRGGERRAEAIDDRQRLKRQGDDRQHAAERKSTHSPPVAAREDFPRLKLRGGRGASNLAHARRKSFSLIRVNYVTDFALRIGPGAGFHGGRRRNPHSPSTRGVLE